jgi:hypothetical protein
MEKCCQQAEIIFVAHMDNFRACKGHFFSASDIGQRQFLGSRTGLVEAACFNDDRDYSDKITNFSLHESA